MNYKKIRQIPFESFKPFETINKNKVIEEISLDGENSGNDVYKTVFEASIGVSTPNDSNDISGKPNTITLQNPSLREEPNNCESYKNRIGDNSIYEQIKDDTSKPQTSQPPPVYDLWPEVNSSDRFERRGIV